MSLQQQWNSLGEHYAQAVNEMVAFAKQHGWEAWEKLKKSEPQDERSHFAKEVFQLLKQANQNNTVEQFRADFPPAHIPFIDMMEDKAQGIGHLCIISEQKLVLMVGVPYYEKRQAYLVDGTDITPLDSHIKGLGKAKQGDVFAIAYADKIITTQGWQGNIIAEFHLSKCKNISISEIIPFNDGKKVLFISNKGIFLISAEQEKCLTSKDNDGDDKSWLSMEHATLSHDNRYIALGEQNSDHILLDAHGEKLNEFYPESSYPHFCLFARDDSQVIFNSCHFYNGVSFAVDMTTLQQNQKDTDFPIIDDVMRVYVGVSTQDYYILGDAFGYIRAIDKNGTALWQHFLGSTISGMAISDDGKTLWVGSHSGFLHKLSLGKGHRDTHTVGTGNHYEEFRLIFWKDEPQVWLW